VTLYGPSGAAVWSSPTIDPSTNSVYVATGDSYSLPAAPTSDAVVAFDLATGAMKWATQTTAGDAFTVACMGAGDRSACPDQKAPDHDFGQSPILLSLPGGKRVLLAGQKSGEVHAFDPDANGRKLWTRSIGRGSALGGLEWGSASDGNRLFAPLSDIGFKEPGAIGRGALDPAAGGGLFAINPADGSVAWTAKASACGEKPAGTSCSPALSAPAAVVPGAIFSGSLDGHFRAYAAADGKVIWDFDTAQEFKTVNGVSARGGSIDVAGPAIANGVVATTSGYGQWGGMRGNVLLVFSVDGK
jgi:polyvinyl alcohol dehydrogenase (cytochrome)